MIYLRDNAKPTIGVRRFAAFKANNLQDAHEHAASSRLTSEKKEPGVREAKNCDQRFAVKGCDKLIRREVTVAVRRMGRPPAALISALLSPGIQ